MTVGTQIGKINALATLNVRGERSVTCRGDRPSSLAGPLPPGSPAVCEEFRKLPDALERADQLDTKYGRNPDLQRCRCTASCSVQGFVRHKGHAYDRRRRCRYDIDFRLGTTSWSSSYARRARSFSPRRSTPNITAGQASRAEITVLIRCCRRHKGISAHLVGQSEQRLRSTGARPLGSSSGSGASVSANLVMAACARRPASPAAVLQTTTPSHYLPHKSMLSFSGGAIGADIYGIDRESIAEISQIPPRCSTR